MKRQRLLVGALLIAAAALAVFLSLAPRFRPVATLSGYVESEPLYPASPLAGRLVRIDVRRGDEVGQGAPLFSVDPSQGEATRAQAAADVAAAEALASDARKGQRPTELGALEANVAAARAVLKEQEKNLARIAPLTQAGATSRADLDAAQAARDSAAAQVTAVEKQLETARLGQRGLQVQAADQRVLQAQATLVGAAARLADMSPSAPSAGRIEDVFFQLGEWVPPNQPVLALLPKDRLRVRFFVPEARLPAYVVGRIVAFSCDGCAKNLRAKITYVSPQPEFTPPVIYSRESRDRLVYLIEAIPTAPEGLAPGQPIDVERLAGGGANAP